MKIAQESKEASKRNNGKEELAHETRGASERKGHKYRWKILALVFLSLAISITMEFLYESTGTQEIAF